MKNYSVSRNLIFSLLSMLLSILQSLWFVPFISRKLGIEAYGYVSVVMTIVNLSTILSLAITAMSSRYITVEMQKKNFLKANRYFNSVFASVIVISLLLMILFTLGAYNIESIINVTANYKRDVQILLLITGLSFSLTVINTPFLSGLYYQNKLYVMYLIITINYIFKIALPIIFSNFGFVPLWGMNLGGLLIDIISLIFYIKTYKSFLPEISIDISLVGKKYVKDILSSGIWISLSKAGSLMFSNIGIYFSNLVMGSRMSGIYASILQLQTLISIAVTAVVAVFIPEMLRIFAVKNKLDLVVYTKKTIRFLSLPLGLISGGVLAYGAEFMTLWVDEPFVVYNNLIVLMIVWLPFSLPAEVLNQVNITMNKVKMPAVITLVFGIFNVFLILLFSFVLDMNIYGIALSQLIISFIRGFLFFPIYTSRQLDQTIFSFYKDIIIGVVITMFTFIIAQLTKNFVDPTSWITLFISVLIVAILTFVFFFFIFLTKQERRSLLETLKTKVL